MLLIYNYNLNAKNYGIGFSDPQFLMLLKKRRTAYKIIITGTKQFDKLEKKVFPSQDREQL